MMAKPELLTRRNQRECNICGEKFESVFVVLQHNIKVHLGAHSDQEKKSTEKNKEETNDKSMGPVSSPSSNGHNVSAWLLEESESEPSAASTVEKDHSVLLPTENHTPTENQSFITSRNTKERSVASSPENEDSVMDAGDGVKNSSDKGSGKAEEKNLHKEARTRTETGSGEKATSSRESATLDHQVLKQCTPEDVSSPMETSRPFDERSTINSESTHLQNSKDGEDTESTTINSKKNTDTGNGRKKKKQAKSADIIESPDDCDPLEIENLQAQHSHHFVPVVFGELNQVLPNQQHPKEHRSLNVVQIVDNVDICEKSQEITPNKKSAPEKDEINRADDDKSNLLAVSQKLLGSNVNPASEKPGIQERTFPQSKPISIPAPPPPYPIAVNSIRLKLSSERNPWNRETGEGIISGNLEQDNPSVQSTDNAISRIAENQESGPEIYIQMRSAPEVVQNLRPVRQGSGMHPRPAVQKQVLSSAQVHQYVASAVPVSTAQIGTEQTETGQQRNASSIEHMRNRKEAEMRITNQAQNRSAEQQQIRPLREIRPAKETAHLQHTEPQQQNRSMFAGHRQTRPAYRVQQTRPISQIRQQIRPVSEMQQHTRHTSQVQQPTLLTFQAKQQTWPVLQQQIRSTREVQQQHNLNSLLNQQFRQLPNRPAAQTFQHARPPSNTNLQTTLVPSAQMVPTVVPCVQPARGKGQVRQVLGFQQVNTLQNSPITWVNNPRQVNSTATLVSNSNPRMNTATASTSKTRYPMLPQLNSANSHNARLPQVSSNNVQCLPQLISSNGSSYLITPALPLVATNSQIDSIPVVSSRDGNVRVVVQPPQASTTGQQSLQNCSGQNVRRSHEADIAAQVQSGHSTGSRVFSSQPRGSLMQSSGFSTSSSPTASVSHDPTSTQSMTNTIIESLLGPSESRPSIAKLKESIVNQRIESLFRNAVNSVSTENPENPTRHHPSGHSRETNVNPLRGSPGDSTNSSCTIPLTVSECSKEYSCNPLRPSPNGPVRQNDRSNEKTELTGSSNSLAIRKYRNESASEVTEKSSPRDVISPSKSTLHIKRKSDLSIFETRNPPNVTISNRDPIQLSSQNQETTDTASMPVISHSSSIVHEEVEVKDESSAANVPDAGIVSKPLNLVVQKDVEVIDLEEVLKATQPSVVPKSITHVMNATRPSSSTSPRNNDNKNAKSKSFEDYLRQSLTTKKEVQALPRELSSLVSRPNLCIQRKRKNPATSNHSSNSTPSPNPQFSVDVQKEQSVAQAKIKKLKECAGRSIEESGPQNKRAKVIVESHVPQKRENQGSVIASRTEKIATHVTSQISEREDSLQRTEERTAEMLSQTRQNLQSTGYQEISDSNPQNTRFPQNVAVSEEPFRKSNIAASSIPGSRIQSPVTDIPQTTEVPVLHIPENNTISINAFSVRQDLTQSQATASNIIAEVSNISDCTDYLNSTTEVADTYGPNRQCLLPGEPEVAVPQPGEPLGPLFDAESWEFWEDSKKKLAPILKTFNSYVKVHDIAFHPSYSRKILSKLRKLHRKNTNTKVCNQCGFMTSSVKVKLAHIFNHVFPNEELKKRHSETERHGEPKKEVQTDDGSNITSVLSPSGSCNENSSNIVPPSEVSPATTVIPAAASVSTSVTSSAYVTASTSATATTTFATMSTSANASSSNRDKFPNYKPSKHGRKHKLKLKRNSKKKSTKGASKAAIRKRLKSLFENSSSSSSDCSDWEEDNEVRCNPVRSATKQLSCNDSNDTEVKQTIQDTKLFNSYVYLEDVAFNQMEGMKVTFKWEKQPECCIAEEFVCKRCKLKFKNFTPFKNHIRSHLVRDSLLRIGE